MPKLPASANPLVSDRVRLLATLAVVALVAAACVQPKGPGVGVRNLEADIVFGVEEKEDKPLTGSETAEGPDDLFGGEVAFDDLPDQSDLEGDDFDKSKFLPKLKPSQSCPPAAANEFADQAATLNVEEPPAAGRYRWQKGGQAEFTGLPGQKFPLTGFESRVIRNVEKLDPTPGNTGLEISYDVVQPLGTGGAVRVSTYLLKTGTRQVESNPGFSDVSVRTGEPERGLSLQNVNNIDKNGNTVSSFNPSTGLLLVPLEVRQGEAFQSSAIDPRTGVSIQYQAQVRSRVEVDACGDILSGWLIEGTRTISGDASGPQPYNFVFAPQFGGIILFERYNERNAQGFFEYEFTIGQRAPDPVEEGEE